MELSLEELWKKASPLSEARWNFAPPKITPDLVPVDAARPTWSEVGKSVLNLSFEIQAAFEPIIQGQENLIAAVEAGKYVALGFRELSPETVVEIPIGIFSRENIDFVQSTVKSKTELFVKVRIIRLRKPKSTSPSAISISKKKSAALAKGGRPSKKEDCYRAFRKLQADGVNLDDLSQKDLAQAVVTALGGPSLKSRRGFDPQTVARHRKEFLGN